MRRIIAGILLLIPVLGIAETVAVIVTGPSQTVEVTPISTTVTPEVVTVTAEVNVTGTETVEVAVPGPQGPPGAGAAFGNITGGLKVTSGSNQPSIWGNYTNNSIHQPGVKGYSAGGPGVYGSSLTGNGIQAFSTYNPAVLGTSDVSQGGKFSSTRNYGMYAESYASGSALFYQYGHPDYWDGTNFAPVVLLDRRPAPYPQSGLRSFHGDMLRINDDPQNTDWGGDNSGALVRGDVDGTERVTIRPRARNNIDLYAYLFDTSTYLDNAMMRLLSVKNNGVEKFSVDPAGRVRGTHANYSTVTTKTLTVEQQFTVPAISATTITGNTITGTTSVSAPSISATTLTGSTLNTPSINASGTSVTIPTISATAISTGTATASGTIAAALLQAPTYAGSASSGGSSTLTSTSHSTKNRIYFGEAHASYYDEPTNTFNLPLIVSASIPAAQVKSDWNASGTIAEILNKPTIPAAQIKSDWTASGTLAEILNKPADTCTGRISYDGIDGTQIYYGSGAPAAGTGVLNDLYINSANTDYYRKEGATPAWVLKGNLTGPANTLTIGTVTTVNYDQPATATVTGTAPDQTLSLAIPKGIPGDPATITRTNITDKLLEPSDTIVYLQPATNSATAGGLVINDYGTNAAVIIRNGSVEVRDSSGVTIAKIDRAAGTVATYDTSGNLSTQLDRTGGIAAYKTGNALGMAYTRASGALVIY